MRWTRIPNNQRMKRAARLRALLIVALFLLLLWIIDARMRPLIESMTAYQARVYATRVLNDAIADQLSAENITYDSLVRLTVSADGRVSSVQTDMVHLNQLKAALTRAVSDRMATLGLQSMEIPIGTLIGGQIFSGRGPMVEFKVMPTGFAESELIHRFDSAGINQTRHQIVLTLKANILALLPGYTGTTDVSADVVLAETVIIGVSPESFTKVLTGEQENVAGLIADYGGANSKK